MKLNINSIYPEYNFDIIGTSYAGAPKENTAMYVTKKVEHLIENLRNHKNCLVFAEEGITISKEVSQDNCIVFSPNPQLAYAEFANIFAKEKLKCESEKKYVLTEEGYYLGENVSIGSNAYIEPGCLIGHDVVIGDNAYIMFGTSIKNAIIGNDFVANAHAVIGTWGYTMYEDRDGNMARIPSLGKVVIGNHVEVGAHNSISVGSSGDTLIDDCVKLDALVYIGHDVHIYKNARIAAGVNLGGFDVIGENVFVGINACVRNRTQVGSDSIVGMGTTVIKNVDKSNTVVGNPARIINGQ